MARRRSCSMGAGLMARIARSVICFGFSVALAGCSLLAKEPVPIGESPTTERPISERPAESSRGQTVAALAKRHVGAPYRWGGSSPSGFDRPRHNGIYVGEGRFIHARQTGLHVSIASLDNGWYASHWVGARRLEPRAQPGDDEER